MILSPPIVFSLYLQIHFRNSMHTFIFIEKYFMYLIFKSHIAIFSKKEYVIHWLGVKRVWKDIMMFFNFSLHIFRNITTLCLLSSYSIHVHMPRKLRFVMILIDFLILRVILRLRWHAEFGFWNISFGVNSWLSMWAACCDDSMPNHFRLCNCRSPTVVPTLHIIARRWSRDCSAGFRRARFCGAIGRSARFSCRARCRNGAL